MEQPDSLECSGKHKKKPWGLHYLTDMLGRKPTRLVAIAAIPNVQSKTFVHSPPRNVTNPGHQVRQKKRKAKCLYQKTFKGILSNRNLIEAFRSL